MDYDTESAKSDQIAAKARAPSKDCWNTCDYPSECRWGQRFGIRAPAGDAFTTVNVKPSTPTPPPQLQPPKTFEDMLLLEGRSEDLNVNGKAGKCKPDFWSALMANATRRKHTQPSSPLAIHTEVAPEAATQDLDGDILMGNFQLVSPVVTLKDIIRKGAWRSVKASNRVEVKQADSVSDVTNCGGEFEFPVLERVKSRDSGYCSWPDL